MSTNPNNLVPMPPKVWSDKPIPARRELLWLAEGRKCHWCGCPTRLCDEPDEDQATIEHIIPRYKGGTNDPENLTSACRKCNCRRSYEDARNMKEGALLGKWPMKDGKGLKRDLKRTALTGDEKKAIMAGKIPNSTANVPALDAVRIQRDQGLKEIATLRREKMILEGTVKSQAGELKLFHKIVEDQEKEFKSLTVWVFIRKKLAEWIRP